MAHTFAATGARGLILISRTKAQLEQTGSEIQTANPKCVVKTLSLNISQPDAVQNMFKQSAATFGQVDVLMANAGIMEPESGTLDKADTLAWWDVCVGYFPFFFNCSTLQRGRGEWGIGRLRARIKYRRHMYPAEGHARRRTGRASLVAAVCIPGKFFYRFGSSLVTLKTFGCWTDVSHLSTVCTVSDG